jgi:hypothetical protein
MIAQIKHTKKAPKAAKVSTELYALLHASPDFKKFGFIYAVTKEKYAQGEVLTITPSRQKAQRYCFTKSKKSRKGYYTKFIFDHVVPADILKTIAKEIGK